MKKIVDDIIAVETGNDFITFTSRGYEDISAQRKYRGTSFQLVGQIKNTRTPFHVDVGIGDVIVPKPEKRLMPVQLEGFSTPFISTYSLESTIAEKFDAMLARLQLNSRMKDFYDIYYLSNSFNFDGRQLQQAVFETLQNRGTPYEKDSFNMIIALAQDRDMLLGWRRFLQRLRLNNLEFESVMQAIDVFLRPVWEAIVHGNEFFLRWSSVRRSWVEVK